MAKRGIINKLRDIIRKDGKKKKKKKDNKSTYIGDPKQKRFKRKLDEIDNY